MVKNVVAIVSDIHSNYEALRVVYADIKKAGIEKIICLGDNFGYGPDPVACFDIVKTFDINLDGNHEAWTRLKMADPHVPLPIINKRAAKSIEWQVNQLMGKLKQKTMTGKGIELPREKLTELLKETYAHEIIFSYLDEHKDELRIPYKQKTKVRLEDTIIKLNTACINEIITKKPELFDLWRARIWRRNKTIEIHNFLELLEESKKTYEMENALFVHDDPLNPGSSQYAVDHATAEKHNIVDNTVFIEKITPEKLGFQELQYVFLGHSHVLPRVFQANGINFVYVGSVGFTRELPENSKKYKEEISYACYTVAQVINGRISDIRERVLPYSCGQTRKKMQDRTLDHKILLAKPASVQTQIKKKKNAM